MRIKRVVLYSVVFVVQGFLIVGTMLGSEWVVASDTESDDSSQSEERGVSRKRHRGGRESREEIFDTRMEDSNKHNKRDNGREMPEKIQKLFKQIVELEMQKLSVAVGYEGNRLIAEAKEFKKTVSTPINADQASKLRGLLTQIKLLQSYANALKMGKGFHELRSDIREWYVKNFEEQLKANQGQAGDDKDLINQLDEVARGGTGFGYGYSRDDDRGMPWRT